MTRLTHAQINASHREYRHKMDAVQGAMRNMALPRDLRSRVEQYYTYLWLAHGTFDLRHTTLDNLSPALDSEVRKRRSAVLDGTWMAV